MRKVRLAINVSLDGYVARTNGALDWLYPRLSPVQEEWTTAILHEVDTLLIDHTTYLEQAAFWPTQTGEMADLMNSHTKIVFSSRLAIPEWNHFQESSQEIALTRIHTIPFESGAVQFICQKVTA